MASAWFTRGTMSKRVCDPVPYIDISAPPCGFWIQINRAANKADRGVPNPPPQVT